jgi:hypothetical protein
LLATHKPGDASPIEYESRGEKKKSTLTYESTPNLEVVPFEYESRPVDDATAKFRDAWLSNRAPEPLPVLEMTCSVLGL